LGKALAQTLSGRSVPAARLTMTWYEDDSHLPDINDYDIIKGLRTYQYFDKEVLFPFGHGLSYSRFAYNGFQAELNEDKKCVDVSFTLRNSGYYHADEVVQIYVRKEEPRVKRPLEQLKAFMRVKDLKPGERREVSLSVPLHSLRYYDVISEQMMLEDGEYTFKVGASSKDIRGQATIHIPGEKPLTRDPFSYTKAINYDDCRNIYLDRGKKNDDGTYSTCVAPHPAGEAAGRYSSCKIIYNDFFFTEMPEKIRLDVMPQEVCKVVVYAEKAMIASEDFSVETAYHAKELTLISGWAGTAIKRLHLNQNVSIQIQIYGNMKIIGFQFLF
jgi:beta-glucosidase